MLEQLEHADYTVATTPREVYAQISSTTAKLRDSLESISESNQLSFNNDNTSDFGPVIPTEFASALFDVAMNNCREKVNKGLSELGRLEAGFNDYTRMRCGMNGVEREDVVEAAVCVIKGLEWGAPRFRDRLKQIRISQSQIQATAAICKDFCAMLIWIQSKLIQVLGDIEVLKNENKAAVDARLENTEKRLIDSLDSIARLRETILMVGVGDRELSARAENPFRYASDVLTVSTKAVLDRVKESEATVDSIETGIKFLAPLLKDDDRAFNQQQTEMGQGFIKEAKQKLPLFCSNLRNIEEFQTHIDVSSSIFTRGLSVLHDVQSCLHDIATEPAL